MNKQRVLITGGTGFVGNHLVQWLRPHYNLIKGCSPNEQPPDEDTIAFDLADEDDVEKAIRQTEPDIIIHAAAISSLMEAEENPLKAIDVNITGTKNIASAAQKNNVAFVLGISSNKAALPTSLYSHTKAIMERTFVGISDSHTSFATVRFGNILWAPGSFLTKWQEMTDQDGIVRSTGVTAKRFLQTIDHACELVQALLNNREEIKGSVITPALKAARIKDILDLWVSEKNCSFEEQESRAVDVPKDVLIGEAECRNTIRTTINNMHCFKISFGRKKEEHLSESVHSENAELYSKEELQDLIEFQ